MSDASDLPPNGPGNETPDEENNVSSGEFNHGKIMNLAIEDEMKNSYLTYAMSVIVSRALPDVRDGLKPSQRRILVAMNDLNLGPGSSRIKCAKISGDTSGNYHPHGESIIYPTLVRMAQDWNMRYVLVDKQGNFGSIAGLPAAAMRYTEARMSRFASLMLEDLKLDTVDFLPTYDERNTEPTVLPSKFPNMLVNGANGIAVGMATSIPPHNLGEICDALISLINNPELTINEILKIVPGPDFPTGGIICGHSGIRVGYHTGRGTIVVRARAKIEDYKNNRSRIIITEIPYQQVRDRIEESIASLVTDGKIEGISAIRNESDLKEPVRLILELKRDADPNVVLNQLYQYSPLQSTFSIILLALVDGKPRVMTIKEMLQEYLRHRITVVRRRTQFLLLRARQRKHTVEGLLLAHANIDEVIRIIRTSKTQADAKQRLMTEVRCPRALMERALGEDGFFNFCLENGDREEYALSPIQVDAILRMTLGQLVNLEQEKLAGEFHQLLSDIKEYNRILSDEQNILDLIQADLEEIRNKYGDKRRTAIDNVDLKATPEDLIMEEMMVVSITANGYIKRTPTSAYRAQRRGGKGLKGAKVKDQDPVEHLIVACTHDYLMFFTNKGKVYWRKIYDIPEAARDALGRAVVNFLQLDKDEKIADCRAVRDFDQENHFLIMATAKGLVKKTKLSAFRRPVKAGLIAIKLKEGDEIVGITVVGPGDDVILTTRKGRAIRFAHTDARPMGRAASGVRGIRLRADDSVVGLLRVDPAAMLLSICENGYGKRTPFGSGLRPDQTEQEAAAEIAARAAALEAESPDTEDSAQEDTADKLQDKHQEDELDITEIESSDIQESYSEIEKMEDTVNPETDSETSARSYRRQARGGGGVLDIRTSKRNGDVVASVSVYPNDQILMMTALGKIQRVNVSEVREAGRNTQGVKIMGLDSGDKLVAVKTVQPEDGDLDDDSESLA